MATKNTVETLGSTKAIATIYAKKIISGERTLDSVPARIRDEVAQILIDMGRGDLVG